MKKVASLVAVALITCSLSACGNRNTAYYRNTNQPPLNTSQDIRYNNAAAPNIGSNVNTTSVYKDGVYLGSGNNRGATGNEAAIVTIRGGRIVDVALKSMDAQGRDITHYSGTTAGTTGNVNTPASGITRGTTPGVNNRVPGTNIGGTTGGTMGGTGTTGTAVGGNTSVHPNGGIANNASPYYGGNNGAGVGGTVGGTTAGSVNLPADGTARGITSAANEKAFGNNPVGSNVRTYDGTQNGLMGGTNQGAIGGNTTTNMSALEIARRDLANTIINQQSANVNISSNQTGAVNNWKLAVTRALESARR